MPIDSSAALPDPAQGPDHGAHTPALDADWLAALRERSSTAPEPPRLPLGWLQSATPIGSIEPAWAERLLDAGLPLLATASGWSVNALRGAALDAALVDIAQALRVLGPAARWRNELVTVADIAGRPVSCIERAAARALGIATHAVHLVGATPGGHVWVQQRAFDKATDPGLWDTMVGGLVSHRESVRATLARETEEEAGLQLRALNEVRPMGHVIVRRPVPEGYMVERIEMFQATVPVAREPVNLDGEVAAFECLPRDVLWQRLRDGAFTLDATLILLHWLQRHGLVRQGRTEGTGAEPGSGP